MWGFLRVCTLNDLWKLWWGRQFPFWGLQVWGNTNISVPRLDPLQIIPIPECPATVGFPLVFHGNGVINSEHAIAYMCLPSSKIMTRFAVLGTIVGFFLFDSWCFYVFLWMSLCWWFVPLESSAARLAKKIVLNGTSSFTTLGGDLRISKGPRARVVHSHLCFFTHCKGSSLKPSKLRFLIYKWDLTWSSIGFLGMDSEAIWGIPILQDVVIVVASSLPKPCILGRCLPIFGFKTASVWAYQVWTDCVGKFHGGWLGGL